MAVKDRVDRDDGRGPESKHPADDPNLAGGEIEFHLHFKLRETLADIRVESREVQLVQFSQISAVRSIHGVEPVNRGRKALDFRHGGDWLRRGK